MTVPVTLPDGYHLENFHTLLAYVLATYDDLLSEQEKALIERFNQLDSQAQSLYVRLTMRKGPLFRSDALVYNDIDDLTSALTHLAEIDLIELMPRAPLDDLLTILRKPELAAICKHHQLSTGNRRKAEVITDLITQLTPEQIYQAMTAHCQWLERKQDALIKRLKLLFFGNARQDFSEFITTQLGIVRYENYRLDEQNRFFTSRRRLDNLEQLSDIQQWQEEQLAEANETQIEQQLSRVIELKQQITRHDEYLLNKCQRIITRLARQLERLNPSAALPMYQHSLYPPSRERQARILAKNKQVDAALSVIATIKNAPQHPDEPETIRALETRLRQQKQRKSRQHTVSEETNLATQELLLPRSEQLIEVQVAEHLTTNDTQVLPLENQLFCGLFGLFFWDIIFSPITDAFFNPYQLGPKDLWSPDFYKARQPAIEKRLASLEQGKSWHRIVLQHCHAKQGIANYFVNWQVFSPELTELLCQRIPPAHLRAVFSLMLEHPGYYRNGFPDLIAIGPQGYHLWEVKGPTDSLQNNQRRWLDFFQQHDIPAGIIYVQWQNQ